MQIGLPITGKYRDPESDQYYNNNDVRVKPAGRQREKYLVVKIISTKYGPDR